MSDEVERVARVLHAEDSADLWEEATSYAKAMHRRAARAAIAAHKEALAAAGVIIVPRERSEGEPTERPGAVDPYTKGLHAGREEMRVRAELIALRWRDSAASGHGIYIGNGIATAIRSLPLQAEGEDTPHG